MFNYKSHTIALKAVHFDCYNNGRSDSFQLPFCAIGSNIKTPVMVTCLDNRRRRVYADCSYDAYALFIRVDGKKSALSYDGRRLVGYASITDLLGNSLPRQLAKIED